MFVSRHFLFRHFALPCALLMVAAKEAALVVHMEDLVADLLVAHLEVDRLEDQMVDHLVVKLFPQLCKLNTQLK